MPRPSYRKTTKSIEKWRPVYEFVSGEFVRLGGKHGDKQRAIEAAAIRFNKGAREIERRLKLFTPESAVHAETSVVVRSNLDAINGATLKFAASLRSTWLALEDGLGTDEIANFKALGMDVPTALRIAEDRAQVNRLSRRKPKVTDQK